MLVQVYGCGCLVLSLWSLAFGPGMEFSRADMLDVGQYGFPARSANCKTDAERLQDATQNGESRSIRTQPEGVFGPIKTGLL